MKTIILILTLFGFYGDDQYQPTIEPVQAKKVSTIRPTLEQKIQLGINEINVVKSEIKVTLAEFKNNN